MKVTEQIDALEAVAVDSFKFLAVTRILACILAMPLLTTITDFCGIVGGFLAETTISGMSWELYFHRAFSLIEFQDFIPATLKTAVFGMIIGTIALLPRLHDDAGHRRRRAARRPARVVFSSILIIVTNVVLVRLIFFLFPAQRMTTHCSRAARCRDGRRPREPAIRLEHVTKSFDGRKVLDDVTLDVADGHRLLPARAAAAPARA